MNIKELSRTVKKFLKNKKFDDIEKNRNILQMLKEILKKSWQSSIVPDTENYKYYEA